MKKILKFCVLFLTGMLLLTCQENPDAEADENGQSLPTETVVSDRVVVFVPEEGTAIEDNILEYDSAANRIVFKLPSVAHSPFVRSASRANNTRAIVQNFNLNEFSNLQVGQYLCVPPNEFVPTGLVLEITDVQYGPGSVAVTGGKPLFSDVIPEAAIKHTFGLMEFFHDAAFEMKFPMGDGINFKVTPSVVTDDKGDTKLKLVVDAKIDLLDGVDIIPGTNEKAEWGSACSFELNPEFTTTIYHKRGAMLPDVFKIRCEGDIITKWDLKLNLKLEKVVETELILATFKLGTVLIPGTPIWISPYLELKIKFGAEGHATIE
ncbi:MAG: hypothetical protein LBP56_01555, partial [Odoribacteraceae bacterium]|nr:hypothetical protein [Odoribacteraceae bacterium]